jgi:putative FmdB family regulatory protein
MPVYVYHCKACDASTEVFQRSVRATRPAVCEGCGGTDLERSVTSFAVYRTELDRLQQLDPKYYKKVDAAIANTPEADPMRHLQRMTPFNAASDPGAPINF